MNSPLNVFSSLSVGLVSLICLPLAALLLLAPLHRLVLPMWPVTIEEHSFSDGTTRLMQAADTQGLLRSRPLSAAVLDLNNGQSMLGYVIAVQPESPEPADSDPDPDPGPSTASIDSIRLPAQSHWQISDLAIADLPCSIAVSQPGQLPYWLPCASVERVMMPNQLNLLQKFEVALARLEDIDRYQVNVDQRPMNSLETEALEQPGVSD